MKLTVIALLLMTLVAARDAHEPVETSVAYPLAETKRSSK